MPERKRGAGTYYKPLPVDFTLLELMPEQGMIGGIHWKGRRVKDLHDEVLDRANGELEPGMLPTTMVAARIRSMHVEGLVANFGGTGSASVIWARTPKGTAFLATKDQVLAT